MNKNTVLQCLVVYNLAEYLMPVFVNLHLFLDFLAHQCALSGIEWAWSLCCLAGDCIKRPYGGWPCSLRRAPQIIIRTVQSVSAFVYLKVEFLRPRLITEFAQSYSATSNTITREFLMGMSTLKIAVSMSMATGKTLCHVLPHTPVYLSSDSRSCIH